MYLKFIIKPISFYSMFEQIQYGHIKHRRFGVFEAQYFGRTAILPQGTTNHTSKSQTAIEIVSLKPILDFFRL